MSTAAPGPLIAGFQAVKLHPSSASRFSDRRPPRGQIIEKDVSRPKLKIYGERNTGTNYLSRLVALNLDVDELPGVVPKLRGVVPKPVLALQNRLRRSNGVRDAYFALTYGRNLGWKHALVEPERIARRLTRATQRACVVTITKNPYSWLLSMHRRPYNKAQFLGPRPTFEEFLRTPWKTVGCERVPQLVPTPVDLWNVKNAAYLRLKETVPALNVKYEDILEDPAGLIKLIATTFSMGRTSDRFQEYIESTKAGWAEMDPDSDKDSNYYRDYYLNERWKSKLSPEAIALINERLDGGLMDHFEYAWLTEDDAATPRDSG